jgi:hypothetical protein
MFSTIELIDQLVFRPCKIDLNNLKADNESKDYEAHNFQLNEKKVKFRSAKVTPTKMGHFVSIWKRNAIGITEPFDISDDFEFYIIATRQNEKFGLFIFPKKILLENRILSDAKKVGKRGFRVYPNWVITENRQARKSQLWQTKYFLEIKLYSHVDLGFAKKLLNLKKQKE